ncbi:MAG TPA: hypothetical protein VLT62_29675 [Candidatus Methylomirabilis sp.]|nr:hypothetical protein [Candidatus Methylomirabilis sp.]
MATHVLGSVKRLVHETATALIDNQIPQKMSDLATSTVKSGFDIVGDVLEIVRDLTKEQAGKQPQP